MTISTKTAPLSVATNLDADKAGMTLFAIAGRYYGDQDDSVEHYWAKTSSEAVASFKADVLTNRGWSDADIQAELDGTASESDGKPWGYITSETVVATLSECGKQLTFA